MLSPEGAGGGARAWWDGLPLGTRLVFLANVGVVVLGWCLPPSWTARWDIFSLTPCCHLPHLRWAIQGLLQPGCLCTDGLKAENATHVCPRSTAQAWPHFCIFPRVIWEDPVSHASPLWCTHPRERMVKG